jgi:hypothetical protein
MAVDFTVEGTLTLHPPVPLAQLWELTEGAGFEVAPHGIGEAELTALVGRAHWVLVPDVDSGTDDQGRPKAIGRLRVQDPGVQSPAIDSRLRDLSAWMGQHHEFDGLLRFYGDVEGEEGAIEPFEDGELPEWHETGW